MTATQKAINSLENGIAWGVSEEIIKVLETENPKAAKAMRNNEDVKTVLALLKTEETKIIAVRAGRGGKVHPGKKFANGQIMMTCGCGCSFTSTLRKTDQAPNCKNHMKKLTAK